MDGSAVGERPQCSYSAYLCWVGAAYGKGVSYPVTAAAVTVIWPDILSLPKRCLCSTWAMFSAPPGPVELPMPLKQSAPSALDEQQTRLPQIAPSDTPLDCPPGTKLPHPLLLCYATATLPPAARRSIYTRQRPRPSALIAANSPFLPTDPPTQPVIKPAWSHGRGSPSHPPISILSPSYTITRVGVGELLSTCPPCC